MNFIEQPLELDHSVQKTQTLLKLIAGCGFGLKLMLKLTRKSPVLLAFNKIKFFKENQ
jgi:hypothetical protein